MCMVVGRRIRPWLIGIVLHFNFPPLAHPAGDPELMDLHQELRHFLAEEGRSVQRADGREREPREVFLVDCLETDMFPPVKTSLIELILFRSETCVI
jgi:hypothetical protein